jgi:hypothetical protein
MTSTLVGQRGTQPCSLLNDGLARALVRPSGSDDLRNGSPARFAAFN